MKRAKIIAEIGCNHMGNKHGNSKRINKNCKNIL